MAGDFDVSGGVARAWLLQPNPTGASSAEVLRPLRNARDITPRPRGLWVVDFAKRAVAEAAMFELPFAHVERRVRPARLENRDKSRRERWWLHGRTGDDIRAATAGLAAVIVTPRVAKHRLFVLAHPRVYFDDATVIVCRADMSTFGVLQSRPHQLWSLASCTWLGREPEVVPLGMDHPRFGSWTRPSGLRYGALARRDDAAGSCPRGGATRPAGLPACRSAARSGA